MGGVPVWLASTSKRDKHGIKTVDLWSRREIAQGRATLMHVLEGVGDTSKWRLFRMQVTLCLHRALTENEQRMLRPTPVGFRPKAIAGTPVEILAEQGVPDIPTTRPCKHPSKLRLPGGNNPRVWIPIGCGECESCKARDAIEMGVCAL